MIASLLIPVSTASAAAGDVTRVSTDSSNAQVTGGDSFLHTWENGVRAASDDGQYVAFESEATNLVTGDTLGNRDIFRKDRTTGDVVRVNVAFDGSQANASASLGSMSADGRYVVFNSPASNLDQNGVPGSAYYRKDILSGGISEIGDAGGGGAASINGAGNVIAFQTNTNYDTANDTNGQSDIYMWSDGGSSPTLISKKSDGTAGDGQQPSITTDGNTIAFFSSNKLLATDTNNLSDVYVNSGGSVTLLTAGADDNSQQPSISGDGRYVAFTSWATNLTSDSIPSGSLARIYLHDRNTGTTILISKKTDGTPSTLASSAPVISRDGSVVVFGSSDTGLVANDTNGSTDVFLYKVSDGAITRVSTTSAGSETCCAQRQASVNGDGSLVVFASSATDLVTGDTNTRRDVFAKELAAPAAATHDLEVTLAGAGSGTVMSLPAGINCGSTCTASFTAGDEVTLSAEADPGSEFTGWTGDCVGTGLDCTVTMDAAKSVTATFATASHLLSVTLGGSGSGEVTSDPAGIGCGTDCSQTYAHGTPVTLNAEATPGSTFGGWTGACSGTATTCVVPMTQARSVGATFNIAAPPPDPSGPNPTSASLTVFKLGTAPGSLTVNGQECASSCSYTYPYGTPVTITAVPGEAAKYTWTGCESVSGTTCTTTLVGDRSVSAEFVRMTVEEFAADAKDRGRSCLQIGEDIQRIYGSAPAIVARALTFVRCTALEVGDFLKNRTDLTLERAAQVLRNVGFGATQIAEAVGRFFQASPLRIGGVLKGLGYGASVIGTALKEGVGATLDRVGRILVELDFPLTSVASTIRNVFNGEGGGIAKLFAEIGLAPASIAKALSEVFSGVRIGGIGGWLRDAGFSATEIARGLKNGLGAVGSQVASVLQDIGFDEFAIGGVLKSVFSQTPAGIGRVLRGLGYSAGEIAEVLKQKIGLTAERVADVLYNGVGYGLETVGRAVRGAFNVGIDGMARIMDDIGAGATNVARVLGDIYNASSSRVASALDAAGYGLVEMARAIKNVFGLGYNALYNLLRSLGFSISAIVDALGDLF